MLREPTRTFLGLIPSGTAGVRTTLDIMKKIVQIYKKRLPVRQFAAELVQDLPPKAYRAEVQRIFDYVKNNIRYTRDVYEVETIQTPDKTIEFGYGDCDDKVVLAATLLQAIGHPVRFVAIGPAPGHFNHVFLETLIGPPRNNNWVAMETTENVELGFRPRGAVEITRHV